MPEPGYPGSGDGATMRPPAPLPSGYKRGDVTTTPIWPVRRTLDPVRAAALHEAVQHEAHRMRPPPDDEAIGRVIAAAKMFEAWLQGPEEFDRWLAEAE